MYSKVYIVGIGPGSKDYILPKAVDTLVKCDVILGFERAVESLSFIKTEKVIVKKLSEITDFIKSKVHKNIAIAASGDPLFYGITDYIKKNYSGNIEIIPGLSSFQYMMSKLGLSWQGSFLGSLHGRKEDFYKIIKDNRISVWLIDKKHSPSYICGILEKNSIDAMVYVGENLSYDDEKITIGTINEIKDKKFDGLSVVVIERL